MGISSNDCSFPFAHIHHAKPLATRDLKIMYRESNLSPSRSNLPDAKSMALQEKAMQNNACTVSTPKQQGYMTPRGHQNFDTAMAMAWVSL